MKKILSVIVVCSVVGILLGAAITLVPAYAETGGIPIDPLLRPDSAPTITKSEPNVSGSESERMSRALDDYREASVRERLLHRIVNIILSTAGVIAIFFIIQNAFFLVTSAGGEEKVTQHKKGLTWAIIGLVLIILSYSIIRFIIGLTFEADQPAPTSPPSTETAAEAPASTAPAQ